jgi:hypothetical protein
VRAALALSIVAIAVAIAVATACGGSRPVAQPRPPAAMTHVDEPVESVTAPVAPPSTAPRPIPRPIPPLMGPLGRVGAAVIPRDVRSRDETIIFEGSPVPFRNELTFDKKSDFWSPCVRDFVQTQPEAAREALGEALSLYSTTCTKDPERRVEFRPPRRGRTAPAQSQLGLIGSLERGTCELALQAAYHGEPIHAERITLIADGVWWSSQRLDFDDADGWEIATLPFTRALARVVSRAIDARDTLLRFESATGYEDVVVTDEMKQDLRVMIDALDAINRP